MRVLFLTQYPRVAPSSRYRVYQMLPFLELQGIRCNVVPLISDESFVRSRQPGQVMWKFRTLTKAFCRRQSLATQARTFDVVYVLKGAFPYGPPLFERRLRKMGVPFLFDFDDAIHIPKPSLHHGLLDRLRATRHVPEVIGMADRVVVPNEFLAAYSRQFNKSVTVVPEAEDTERLTPRTPHRNGERLVVGWVGSPSTAKYLKLIEPALREVCRRYPQVVLRVVGGEFSAPGLPIEHVPWSLEREVELFHGLDIGVMPLPLEEWSNGKSGCKQRQYMATGVPGVATRIGYNCELVEHGRTGLLVKTQDEWVAALGRLIEDAELRNCIAREARRSVVKRFAISVVGPQLLDVLRVAADRSLLTRGSPDTLRRPPAVAEVFDREIARS